MRPPSRAGRPALRRLLVLVMTAVLCTLVVPAAPAVAAPVQLSPGPGEGSLTVVAAEGNTVYTAWQDRSFTGSLRILFKRSVDGGLNFMGPTSLSGFGASHPSIAAYGDKVYVAWQQYSDFYGPGRGNREIWLATSTDRGATFAGAARQDADDADSLDPQVVATADGAYLAWADLHGDVYLKRPSGGGAWIPADRIATGYAYSYPPSIAADGETVAVAWRMLNPTGSDIQAVVTYDGGTTGLDSVINIPPSVGVRSTGPHVAVIGPDVYIAWQEQPAGGGPETAMVASARNMEPFAAPVALGLVRGDSRGPSIVARRGLVAVAWNNGSGVSVSSSIDRGLSFSGPNRAATGGPSSLPVLGLALRPASGGPRAAFDWSVPDRFGADTEDPIGVIDYRTTPEAVALPATLPTTLDGCASTTGGTEAMTYAWRVDDVPADGTTCSIVAPLIPDQVYQVVLAVTQGGVTDTVTRDVVVDDLLVVSMGDSVAAGEGNPDIPGNVSPVGSSASWEDGQCDRSAWAGPAQAALALEAADPHTSVTFVHLACSGASISGPDDTTGGLLSEYAGINPGDGLPLPSQVDQFNALAGPRPVDALLVSIGANDIGFGSIVKDCILLPDCTTGATKDALDAGLAALPVKYAALATALAPIVPADKVYLSEYFDPTTTATGAWDLGCVADSLPTLAAGLGSPFATAQISDTEARWLSGSLVTGLNAAVRAAATSHGWQSVGGMAAAFRGHGYCSSDPWTVSLTDSFLLSSDAVAFLDVHGAFHPNRVGQAAYGTALAGAVSAAWQADAAAAAAAPPEPGVPALDTRGDVYLAWTDGPQGSRATPQVMAATLVAGSAGLHPSGVRQLSGSDAIDAGLPSVAATAEGAWVGWTQTMSATDPTTSAYRSFVAVAANAPPNLAVHKVGLVQAPANPMRLVAGKSTAVQVDVTSTFTSPTWVDAHYQVSDGLTGLLLDNVQRVSVRPGASTIYLQPPAAATPFRPAPDMLLTATATLVPVSTLAESHTSDNSGTSTPDLPVVESRKLKVLYVPVAGASCGNVESFAESVRAYTEGLLPLPDGELVQSVDCGWALTGGVGQNGVKKALVDLDIAGLINGYDEVVGVVPVGWFKDHWAAGVIGLANRPPSVAPPNHGLLAELGSGDPSVVAHELGHTFGLEHDERVPAPGYWPAMRTPKAGIELMNAYAVPVTWISPGVFDYLLGRFSTTPGDPPVLIVRGVIHADGTVEAGPWFRQEGLLDAALGAPGSLTLEYRDADGALLGSVGLEPSSIDHEANPPSGDRMFAARVPDLPTGTRSLVLREGDTPLLTRPVSAHSPTVSFTAPLPGPTYVAGQSITATIEAADADAGDTLTHTYAISSDAGVTWRPLALDVTGSTFTFTSADDQVGTDVRLRVTTTDGVNTATADSPPFAITAGAPPPPERVVFRVIDNQCSIWCTAEGLYTMSPDGTDLRRVVVEPPPVAIVGGQEALYPAWSPDGTQLAFVYGPLDDGQSAIVVSAADGSEARVVARGGYSMVWCPDWSPDGKRLLFLNQSGAFKGDSGLSIRTVAVDGTDLQTVLSLADQVPVLEPFEACPRWSPDGLTIAFASSPEWGVRFPYTIHPDGTDLTRLSNEAGGTLEYIDWSPDGSRLLFIPRNDGNFWTMRPDGTDRQFLAPILGWATHGYSEGPRFAPDGNHLYFGGANPSAPWGRDDLVVMDVPSASVNITYVQAGVQDGLSWSIWGPDWVAPPAAPPPPPPPPPVVPAADAGGPYTVAEDAVLVLSAGMSGLASAETPLAEWDLDADGTYDDATGLNPEVTFADAGTYPVRVRLTPSSGSPAVSAPATVTVLSAPPPALVAAPAQTVVAGVSTAFALAGITDPGTGGHTATVAWGDGATGAATVSDGADGTPPAARATHAFAAAGEFTVTVRVCDTAPPAPADTCAETSFVVTVVATPRPNTAPVAEPLSASTEVGVPVAVTPAASDADGDPLTFRPAGAAAHGEVSAQPDGTFRYTPDTGFGGPDTFTYVADDGQVASAPAAVTVQVGPVLPVAVDDTLEITGGATAAVPTEIPVSDLLANDHDPASRPIVFAGAYADDPGHLAVEPVDNPGPTAVLRLTAAAGFAGDTTFSYGISAGPGTFVTAQVRVTVIAPVPGAPAGVGVSAAGSAATVTWSAPSWTGGSPVTGYTATLSPGGRTCTTTGALTCGISGLADGRYTVTVTASNASWTSVPSSPAVAFWIDTIRPTAKAPAVSFGVGATIATTTVPVHVAWSGADTGSGIARFELALSRNGGRTYATIALPSPTATGADRSLAVSSTTNYRFRVRSIDAAGNASSWVVGPTFHVLRTQESSGAFHVRGTWSRGSSPSASGGHYRATPRSKASVSYTFTGRSVAWVAYRGATLGKAKVYLDGHYKATIDLRASPTQWRRIVYSYAWTKSARHTIKIVCLATSGRPRIDLDAFVVLK